MKLYKQKAFLFLLFSGCVDQKLIEMDEMNSLIASYDDDIFSSNQIITQQLKKNDNKTLNKKHNNQSNKNNSIVITFEKDKSNLNHNQNATAINLFLSEIKTSDCITIQATSSINENEETYKKRLKAVKEYLSKKMAIEQIKELPNRKGSQKEDDLYSVICTIVPNPDFKNNVHNKSV